MSDDVETRGGERRPPPEGLQLVVMAESGTRSVMLSRAGSLTIGRAQAADVQIDDPSLSRAHARIHIGGTIQLEDLGSANGTFLHGEQLVAGRRVDVTPGEFFEIGSLVCVIRGSAARDRLRQLRSHEYFEARLQDEVSRARRANNHPAIVRVRLEDDDEEAVEALLAGVDAGDVVARYAASEYELLLPDATTDGTEGLIDTLRVKLAAVACVAEISCALYPRDGSSAEELFAAAGRAFEPDTGDRGDLIVATPAMRKLHELLGRVAKAGVNVLLLGETGVGKEVFATQLHARSARSGAPFVKLNCAALTAQLFESELFGHERGAFTGADRRKLGLLETAHGGVVFLDEIGELELSLQAKLLRVIEDRRVRRVGGVDEQPIDVLFVGATNRDLAAEVAAHRFRADLYYRLNGFALEIPPLRERRDEIEPLASRFLAAAAERMGFAPPPIADDARAALRTHRWPGNIRELRNMMERAVLLSAGSTIRPVHLPLENLTARPDALQSSLARASAAGEVPADLSADEQAERTRIIETLAAAYGNQTRAAEVLGISRRWLTTKMARYHIPRPRKR